MLKEPTDVWASQVFTPLLTLAGCLWAFCSDSRQELQPMEDEVVEERSSSGVSQIRHSLEELVCWRVEG